MHVGGVLDRLKMTGGVPSEPEFVDRCGCVRQQSRLERRINPGARDDNRASLRTDLVAVHLDPGVDRLRIEELFLRQEAFERLGAQSGFRRQVRMQLTLRANDDETNAPLEFTLEG